MELSLAAGPEQRPFDRDRRDAQNLDAGTCFAVSQSVFFRSPETTVPAVDRVMIEGSRRELVWRTWFRAKVVAEKLCFALDVYKTRSI